LATESLTTLKKELTQRSEKELMEICIRLAKLKKENKEMLAYLLYEAEDPLNYAERVKEEIEDHFDSLSTAQYQSVKQLRKTLRLITKYVRFTASKQGELELQLHFIRQFIENIEPGVSWAPLQQLLFRTVNKSRQLIGKLHEDLQYDYKDEYNRAAEDILNTFHKWNREKFRIEMIRE
jgi:DNA polymerase III gamma/tau subunit